ncbi:hypothetical protein [Ruania alba]|uniref:Uncharacterized protein n=1 Tax=Ruania alba TaxID=648782 RepID=A0A1H5BNB8_9MICO|nr:hypothetical protein [Ruania alba]SED55778.1 hypothetical protein SAMN04488554_0148 [Ruania alba]
MTPLTGTPWHPQRWLPPEPAPSGRHTHQARGARRFATRKAHLPMT